MALSEMGLGLNGIGLNGYWPNWELDQVALDEMSLAEMGLDEVAIPPFFQNPRFFCIFRENLTVITYLTPSEAAYFGKERQFSDSFILSEHRTETEKVSAKSYTRAQGKSSTSEIHKSAITEHVASSNHVIGWDEAKIIDQEPDKTTRSLKESIWIRSRGNKTMNKYEGAYRLDRVYDQIITKRQPKSLANTSSSQTKKFADI